MIKCLLGQSKLSKKCNLPKNPEMSGNNYMTLLFESMNSSIWVYLSKIISQDNMQTPARKSYSCCLL